MLNSEVENILMEIYKFYNHQKNACKKDNLCKTEFDRRVFKVCKGNEAKRYSVCLILGSLVLNL